MNTTRALGLIGLVLLPLTACNQGSGSVCTPDHTTVAEGGFCVKIPKDAKAGPPKANEYSWTWEQKEPFRSMNLTVRVVPGEKLPDDLEKRFGTARPDETRTKGDFAGGKGKWAMSKSEKNGSTLIVLLDGPKGVVHCEMAASGAPKELDERLALCQTLVPL